MGTLLLKTIAVWMFMLLSAICNAFVRENLFTPAFGDIPGRAVSSLTLSFVIFIIIFSVIPWFRFAKQISYWMLGVGWMMLTVTFEFSFGRFRGVSWEVLLSEYNLLEGRLWVLVLISIAISPVVSSKIRGIAAERRAANS